MATKSFDQAEVNTADMKATKAKYEACVKVLAGVDPVDPKYAELRRAKRDAAVAMHRARQAAEESFYGERVAEVQADFEKVKKANEEGSKIAN